MRLRFVAIAAVAAFITGAMTAVANAEPRGPSRMGGEVPPSASGPSTSTAARVAPGGQVVLRTPADEWNPVVTRGYLMWSANSADDPDHYNVFARPFEKPAFEVNAPGTEAFLGGVDGTRLVYQSVHKRQSDIKFFDLGTKAKWNPPAGINTSSWEWGPSVSGDWLLFNRPVGSEWRVLLVNVKTGEKRVLASIRHTDNNYLEGTQVNGNYAVWFRANFARGGDSDVFVYDIDAKTTTMVTDVASERYPSVSADGTVYFRRWNGKATLMRYDVTARRTKAILTLASPYNIWSTYPFIKSGVTYLYYDPFDASKDEPGPSDIYRVRVPD